MLAVWRRRRQRLCGGLLNARFNALLNALLNLLKAFNVVFDALPGVPEYSKWAKMSIPGHANLAEYKSGSKCDAPLWRRDLWGESCPAFLRNVEKSEKDRRDPARSIFETILSRKRFFKNSGFFKNVGSGIMVAGKSVAGYTGIPDQGSSRLPIDAVFLDPTPKFPRNMIASQ